MKYSKDKTELIKARVSKEFQEEITDYCKSLNISVSDFIRISIMYQMETDFLKHYAEALCLRRLAESISNSWCVALLDIGNTLGVF